MGKREWLNRPAHEHTVRVIAVRRVDRGDGGIEQRAAQTAHSDSPTAATNGPCAP